MSIRSHFAPLRALQGIDWVAIGLAIILSFACLVRGTVDDAVLALMLLGLLPLLFVALDSDHTINREVTRLGIVLLLGFALVLTLQLLMLSDGAAFDKAAWMRAIGRFLWLVITGIIALFVGSQPSSARLFLLTLLMSGVACIALTFFWVRNDMAFATVVQPYRHGLVNANHAATYLGVILLLSIAHSSQLVKLPTKATPKIVLDFIDTLNLSVIMKWGFLVFSLLIALSGLLMTASRGGIFLSLLCSAGLISLLLLKNNLRSGARMLTIAASIGIVAIIVIWGFSSYGQYLTAKLQTNGTHDNSRLEIITAVVPMIGNHPWLGTGLGSFPGAFQPYRPTSVSSDGIIDKAHNSYLEFAAEMGLPLLMLLLLIIGRIGFLLMRGVRNRKERYTMPALGLTAWSLAALHSLIDFPLQIPALAAIFIAMIIVCTCQADTDSQKMLQPSSPRRKRIRIRKRQHAH